MLYDTLKSHSITKSSQVLFWLAIPSGTFPSSSLQPWWVEQLVLAAAVRMVAEIGFLKKKKQPRHPETEVLCQTLLWWLYTTSRSRGNMPLIFKCWETASGEEFCPIVQLVGFPEASGWKTKSWTGEALGLIQQGSLCSYEPWPTAKSFVHSPNTRKKKNQEG